jgi:hypothetical protein
VTARGRHLVLAASTLLLPLVTGCSLIPGMGQTKGRIRGVETVTVLPFAYATPSGGRTCDLCPGVPALHDTSRRDALLVTGFFYEALSRYPRFVLTEPGAADALADVTMADGLELARIRGGIDAVLVGALVETRALGTGRNGEPRPAGVHLYAALIDVGTGAVRWHGEFDADEKPEGRIEARLEHVIYGEPRRWSSAISLAQSGARKLVKEMVAKLARSR